MELRDRPDSQPVVEVTPAMMIAGGEAFGQLVREGGVVSDLQAAAEVYLAMRRAICVPPGPEAGFLA
jgi:hypothetical protein